MDFDFVEGDSEDDPRGNTQHIADNGLRIDEVEDVIQILGAVRFRAGAQGVRH